jgi:hypothetical protein
MITKIDFERVGLNTNKKPVVVISNDMYELVRVVENEVEKEGINPALLDFRWNPHGDGKNYLVRHGINSIVGAFTITNVGS